MKGLFMKKISKTATISSIAIMSAVFIAGAITTNVSVRDTSSDNKAYFESDNNVDAVGDSLEALATLSADEYKSYVAGSDSYLGSAKEDKTADKSETKKAVTKADTKAKKDTVAKKTTEKKAAKKASKFDTVAISKADPYVNIRQSASEDAEILGKLYKGAIGKIVETKGDWVKIESGDVTGYVKAEYIISGDEAEKVYDQYTTKVATVNTETLRVRSEATTDSSIIAQVGEGERFDVISEKDGWAYIDVKGDKGYVSSDYLTFTYDYETAISIEEEQAAIEAAKKAEEEALRKEQEEKEAAEKAAKEAEEAAKKEAEAKEAEEAAKKEEASKESTSSDQGSVTEETVTSEASSYEDDDLKLLACLVYCEAGGESYEAQLAVANVVLNRKASSLYPNTISGVIYQPSQFGPASCGSLARRLNNYTASGSSYTAAKAALEGTNNIGSRKNFNLVSETSSTGDDVVIGVIRFW